MKIKKTDWSRVIKDLQKKGYTQQDIAKKTGLLQGKVSALLHGANIYYDGGRALLKLLRKS